MIRQVTDGPHINHPTYFLQSSFFPGDREMFFTSYRTGDAQLFEISLGSGETRQLTRGAPIHPYSAALHPDGATLVVTRGGELWAIYRATLEERRIFALRRRAARRVLHQSRRRMAHRGLCGELPHRGLVVSRFDGAGSTIIPFPRTVIHPQFHPLEPEWIEFSGDPAPRMHRVRRDGTGLECLYQHGNDEFIVHETFLGSTGDLVFTVWPRALRVMDWTTRAMRTIAEYNAWHIAPDRAGRRILCDTNHPDEGLQIIDAQSARAGRCASRVPAIRARNGANPAYALAEDFAQARNTLSWMENAVDTVYGPQHTHPHPSWSRDESMVAFASDRTGVTQVYVVGV